MSRRFLSFYMELETTPIIKEEPLAEMVNSNFFL